MGGPAGVFLLTPAIGRQISAIHLLPSAMVRRTASLASGDSPFNPSTIARASASIGTVSTSGAPLGAPRESGDCRKLLVDNPITVTGSSPCRGAISPAAKLAGPAVNPNPDIRRHAIGFIGESLKGVEKVPEKADDEARAVSVELINYLLLGRLPLPLEFRSNSSQEDLDADLRLLRLQHDQTSG